MLFGISASGADSLASRGGAHDHAQVDRRAEHRNPQRA